jgi:type II secretory ATPase GspE/PulE/Tfp pilus assembly ATPase PilB-like protein
VTTTEHERPIAALLDQILATALAKQATHVEISHAATLPSVRFWIDGEWQEQLVPSLAIHVPLVRRLGVMIGHLPPARGKERFGRLQRRIGDHQVFLLLLIERDEHLRALVELVDHETFVARRAPLRPSGHPFRG